MRDKESENGWWKTDNGFWFRDVRELNEDWVHYKLERKTEDNEGDNEVAVKYTGDITVNYHVLLWDNGSRYKTMKEAKNKDEAEIIFTENYGLTDNIELIKRYIIDTPIKYKHDRE